MGSLDEIRKRLRAWKIIGRPEQPPCSGSESGTSGTSPWQILGPRWQKDFSPPKEEFSIARFKDLYVKGIAANIAVRVAAAFMLGIYFLILMQAKWSLGIHPFILYTALALSAVVFFVMMLVGWHYDWQRIKELGKLPVSAKIISLLMLLAFFGLFAFLYPPLILNWVFIAIMSALALSLAYYLFTAVSGR